MAHEVILMKELGALSRFWDKTLRLAYVRNYNMAHICIQLLSSELKLVISTQLLLSDLRKACNLLPTLLHELALAG